VGRRSGTAPTFKHPAKQLDGSPQLLARPVGASIRVARIKPSESTTFDDDYRAFYSPHDQPRRQRQPRQHNRDNDQGWQHWASSISRRSAVKLRTSLSGAQFIDTISAPAVRS